MKAPVVCCIVVAAVALGAFADAGDRSKKPTDRRSGLVGGVATNWGDPGEAGESWVASQPLGNYLYGFRTETTACVTFVAAKPRSYQTLFSREFRIPAASRLVEIILSLDVNLFPNGVPGDQVGAALDCRVEQDIDANGSYDTSVPCSGIDVDPTFAPYVAFEPLSDPNGTTNAVSYTGYVTVPPPSDLSSTVLTRVTITIQGIAYAGTGGFVQLCNSNLRIGY
jgi:hypothetical protein